MALLAALPGFLRAAEKSSLTSTPSGILSDGFMCDCDQLTIVRNSNDG